MYAYQYVYTYPHIHLGIYYIWIYGLLRRYSGKESICQCRRCKRYRFHPWVGNIPWNKKWYPTPVFLPRKSHGQRTPLSTHTHMHMDIYLFIYLYGDTHTHTIHTYTYMDINIYMYTYTYGTYTHIHNDFPLFMVGVHPDKPIINWKCHKSQRCI